MLDANPPHWLAVLNFTRTLRQVPRHVDGRTDDEKEDDDYRPYASIWLPGTQTDWEEYDTATLLNSMDFDSGRATYALLRRGETRPVLPRLR